MSQWPYPYCPHQAYNNNLQIRLSCIPYTFVPDPTIDAFTNVNVKCANLDKHNIPTLAYQTYFTNKQSLTDTNFARDYYKQTKDLNSIKYDNNIVEEKKIQMQQGNAYILAENAADQYQKFEQGRKNALDNARRRAVSTLKLHYQQKKDDKLQANMQNGDWLKKLYHKLQEVAKHIIEGEGEDAGEKERMFLLSKGSLTANYLSQIKVRNPKAAFDILEELRVLMLKKKLKFQNQRAQQQKNVSMSASYASEASQNTSQGSMLSEATSVNESKIDGEEEIVGRYCDFEALSKKWGLTDVEQVRSMIRLIMTKKFVYEAETNAIKKKREAEKINKSLQKLNPQLSKKIQSQKQARASKSKSKAHRAQSVKSVSKKQVSPQKKIMKEINLNKQQILIKQKLLQGGQFDAIGEKYSRNRNYSTLFAKKQKQIKIQFAMKEKPKQTATPKSNLDKQNTTLNFST